MQSPLKIALYLSLFSLVLASPALAAEMKIVDYPDHVVVEVDGSMDARSNAAPTAARPATASNPAPAVNNQQENSGGAATIPPVDTPAPEVLAANPAMGSDLYANRLDSRQAEQVAQRLAARQERWAKYRKAPAAP